MHKKNLKRKEVILIGSGGNVFDIIEALQQKGYSIYGYVDKCRDYQLENSLSIPYLGDDEDILQSSPVNCLVTIAGVGKAIEKRKALFKMYNDKNMSFIFPDASVSSFADISSKGVLIFGNTTIKSFCKVKDNVFINTGTVIGHHTVINSNSVISIGVLIGGNVAIEEDVFIGMGAKIFEGVTISKGSIIGAGALVRKSVPINSKIF